MIKRRRGARMPDPKKCEHCGDDSGEMFINGRCHPGGPLQASVLGDVITIRCYECKKLIVKYKIQREPND